MDAIPVVTVTPADFDQLGIMSPDEIRCAADNVERSPVETASTCTSRSPRSCSSREDAEEHKIEDETEVPTPRQGSEDAESYAEEEEENEFAKRGQPVTTEQAAQTLELFQPPAAPSLPTKSGYMKKKSPNPLKGWQQRYFRLSDRKLNYYKDHNSKVQLGCINFDIVTVEVTVLGNDSPTRFRIAPLGSSRVFELQTESSEDLLDWARCLYKHINRSEGQRINMTSVALQSKFWKFDRISEKQFRDMADTGDIILFRSKDAVAKMQRSFTRSHWDHVGVILRYRDGDIALFEATGLEGVAICTWNEFMHHKWHLLYPRLALRRLYVDRTRARVTQLETFIKEVIGKPYKLTAKKLMNRKGSAIQSDGFFCSELVARAYKEMGLLPEDRGAHTYWPGSFSRVGKLSLQDGAELGEELMIDFTLDQPQPEVSSKSPGSSGSKSNTNSPVTGSPKKPKTRLRSSKDSQI
eukprot:GILJ01003198.1.p1 GENE.GILJ01003198.1~~GILJ01003198.1.p1  ORF type:complete len:467 (+),score=67.59 GILJ01003198.1:137-1537(+)